MNVEELEDQFVDVGRLEMHQLHDTRKQLLLLRATALPMRRLVEELSKSSLIKEWGHMSSFFADVNDHIGQLIEEVAMIKDLLDNLYETQMIARSDNMNAVMKTLTIFSAIFIPLSFLAGVFGMNFTHFPGLDAPNAIMLFSSVCVMTAVMMIAFFKHKKWL
jgi:magnesium transporter